jgi:hypothetical protein
MTDMNGTCLSKTQSQSMVSVHGVADHQMGITVTLGTHRSSDSRWNGAQMTSVVTTDVTAGQGLQRGYFHNIHTNGDTSHGTFEAKVTTTDTTTVEGNWYLSAGTGALAKVTGSGPFKTQMTNTTDADMKWSGSYELG